MAEVDGLVAAFSEYAASEWGSTEWRAFGRESGTADILSAHPRLYRSLDFGDEDYGDAVWSIVPKVLREGAGPSIQEKMTLVAEFVPDLPTWVAGHASHRTRKRLTKTLLYAQKHLPPEWQTASKVLLNQDSASQTTSLSSEQDPSSKIHSNLFIGPPVTREPNQLSSPTPAWQASATSKPTEDWAQYSVGQAKGAPAIDPPKNIFLVHGRDHDAVNNVKLRVYDLTGVMPEILADQAGQSDTIIEKFERRAGASDYAIVLLTPDDEGRLAGSDESLKPRARQNVILELGYFFGRLGRKRVAVLNRGVEQPSDVHGLNYISYGGETWLEELRKELRAAGFVIRT